MDRTTEIEKVVDWMVARLDMPPLSLWNSDTYRFFNTHQQCMNFAGNGITDRQQVAVQSLSTMLINHMSAVTLDDIAKAVPRALRPVYVGDAVSVFFTATTFVNAYITSSQIEFLMAADALGRPTFGIPIGISKQSEELLARSVNLNHLQGTKAERRQFEREVAYDPEQAALADAFSAQLIEAARASYRTPLVGEFVLRKPFDLPLIDELPFDHIRLNVTVKGMWGSFIYDHYALPFWWSPVFDTLTMIAVPRYMWALRTFCAAMWHDFVVVRNHAYTPLGGQWRTPEERARDDKDKPVKQKVIVLPRSVKTVIWAEGDRHVWRENLGLRTDYSVRGHYRQIGHLGWETSDSARALAEANGFPAPPNGWTFVHPYEVGRPEAEQRARVICKGWQAAKVVLGKM